MDACVFDDVRICSDQVHILVLLFFIFCTFVCGMLSLLDVVSRDDTYDYVL